VTQPRLTSLDPRQRRGVVIRTSLIIAATWVALVTGYYLIPFRGVGSVRLILHLVAGLVLVCLVLAWQMSQIGAAEHPVVRAVRALAVILPVFLLMFSGLYLSMSHASASMFSRPLDHTEALYFTITTFSTTGFGDIVPARDPARIAVSIQMLLDLVFLGVVVRLLVRQARSRLSS